MSTAGATPDPFSVICKQAGLSLIPPGTAFPLYDAASGNKLDNEVDQRVETLRDALFNDALLECDATNLNLGPAVEAATVRFAEKEENVFEGMDRRVLAWHWSHLEYGCGAPLEVRHTSVTPLLDG